MYPKINFMNAQIYRALASKIASKISLNKTLRPLF